MVIATPPPLNLLVLDGSQSLALMILIYMCFWFVLGTLKKNNGIVDIAWGLGFVLNSWMLFYLGIDSYYGSGANLHSVLILTLITLWGLRLFFHIARRNIGKAEDFRYAKWRKEWGKWVEIRAFFQVYMLQGLIMFLMLVPTVQVYVLGGTNLDWVAYLGLGLWVLGFLFEVIGDYQLSQFIKVKKKGQIMQTGLWKYTRHPNYFGEALLWWGVSLLVFDATGSPWSFMTAIIISYLLRFVSGVPMLEKKYEGRPEWESYKKKTPVFVPWFPKKK